MILGLLELCRDCIGIMEKETETTILGFKVLDLGFTGLEGFRGFGLRG